MVAKDPNPPERLLAGRYRLGSRLGSGLDAAVFEGFDEELQRLVVVKLVNPDLGDRAEVRTAFQSAMGIAEQLHHPNIAAVFQSGVTDWNDSEVLFVVTEHLAGGSLRDILDRGRLLSPSQALVVGLDACKGLDAMHRHGLLHHDIRPSTLVFGDDRRLRIVDAGLAEVLAVAAGGITNRSNDRARYCSPEQARGHQAVAKSDVYSLCLTLLEAVTGSVPFDADSTVASLANRIEKLMPVSADLGALAAVLERAGRPEPNDRYTAAEFGRALVQSAEKLPRPQPIPIVATSMFEADKPTANQPVEPSGPLLRPVGSAGAVAEAVAGAAGAPTVETSGAVKRVGERPTITISERGLFSDTASDTIPVRRTPPSKRAPRVADPAAQSTTILPSQGSADPDDYDDNYPYGTAPGNGRRWFLVALVVMALGGGVLAWYNAQPKTSTVPELVGLEEGIALNQVSGTFVGVVVEEASESIPVGVVIRTDPSAGAKLEHGKDLTLYVSSGPAPRVLPELTGLTKEQALDALTKLGLVMIEAEAEFSDTVPLDSVISWTVPDSPTLAAGDTVTKGTTLRVVLSLGPEPRVVPDLTGTAIEVATTALEAETLLIAIGPEEFSDTIPIGRVVSQTPAAGTTVEFGTIVTVSLSKGPDLVAIPSLAGLDPAGATAALTDAGFTVGVIDGNTSKQFANATVNGVLVSLGQQFPRGTIVDVHYQK